ncbi:Hypothetical protein GbCGDNIH1_1996 [Granulibacter bethesdensis CGDNIH1]|uniref:Uncharacterized protein n=1 Tax=Granulibacter bethesdensis (strain ATCC BAA-1260 / CGDNIH1) TaxID=391165 RepID=Q0BQK8_GRABC|nr:Hypothetical protein GbCGDNIH1_1996 [Granulibacter bethesdensis CGDNIH1]APH52762.1 Hypothetical protein GbCGDNIH5_1996 [Granulibacter bethesdensis]APH65450.1 Hypothetical protein GbCGDNIH1I4_1996 [Granulibacter bethesdensis]
MGDSWRETTRGQDRRRKEADPGRRPIRHPPLILPVTGSICGRANYRHVPVIRTLCLHGRLWRRIGRPWQHSRWKPCRLL